MGCRGRWYHQRRCGKLAWYLVALYEHPQTSDMPEPSELERWSSFIRATLNNLALLWALVVVGVFFFVARWRFAADIPPTLYWAIIGAGVGSFISLAYRYIENGSSAFAKKRAASNEKLRREQFVRANFDLAEDHEKSVLLWYKERNQRRFIVRSAHRLTENMAAQGLLEPSDLRRMDGKRHYQIPEVVWRLLDKPPKGWKPKARIAEAHWETDGRI